MTNKGWNIDNILGKTTTLCLIIMMIALMVFGVAATAFGIQAYRDYDALMEEYIESEKIFEERLDNRKDEIADHYKYHTCLKVSEEYFTEFLYNSKENVGIGETSELNELIDKLLGFVAVD